VITRTVSFAVYCRHCGGGVEPMSWDQMGDTGVARLHTRCPECKRWWTYTTTVLITKPHVIDSHRGGPMSLFPDDYPDEETEPKERRTCCADIVAGPGGVPDFAWRMVHTFGHTRSAVGAASLAGLAGCTVTEAREALEAAEGCEWLRRLAPEPYQKNPPALWQGRLSQRSAS
jgi:hypothetical protein